MCAILGNDLNLEQYLNTNIFLDYISFSMIYLFLLMEKRIAYKSKHRNKNIDHNPSIIQSVMRFLEYAIEIKIKCLNSRDPLYVQ